MKALREILFVVIMIKAVSWCILNLLAASAAMVDYESACSVKRRMMYALPSWAVTCKLMEPIE
jgi:hypothetical protein